MRNLFDANQWLPPARELVRILLDAGVKSAVVLAAAGVALVCMRRRPAAARYMVCFLAVASLPLLPALSWMLPGWRVLPAWMDLRESKPVAVEHQAKTVSAAKTSGAIPAAARQAVRIAEASAGRTYFDGNDGKNGNDGRYGVPIAEDPAGRRSSGIAQAQILSQAVQIAVPQKPPAERAGLNVWRAGLLLWLAGVVLALTPVVLGVLSLRRLERAARRETAAAWLDLLDQLLTRLGFQRRVVLLKAAQRRMPMTWGVLCPKVLLPEESGGWPEERRGAVLLHELAHAKRRDYLTHLVARLVCALYWFNPMVWLAARRMVAERERACDDIVLRHGAEPADYAEQVLEISAGLSTGWLAGCGGVAMARPSNLESRLLAILDAKRDRAALTRRAAVSASLLLTVILVPVAMMKAAPGPQPANPQSAISGGAVVPAVDSAPASPAPQERRPTESAPSANRPSSIRNPQLVDTNVPPLERNVSLVAQQMPLKDALAAVCRAANVQLDFDTEGVETAGVKADLPITLTIKDETLDSAVGRIFGAFQPEVAFNGIYREMRGEKLRVTSANAEQARTLQVLPDWLKPPNNRGTLPKVDDDRNVITIYAGATANDEFLAKLRTLPKLRELDIEATKFITPAGLAHLAELPALEKLNLYEVNTDGPGLGNDALPFVARIKTLRDLGIAQCGVKDDGARALEGMTQLTALNLSGNQLTDAGMKSLAGLTNLQSLSVSGPDTIRFHMQITDEGIKQLSNLTELRDLSISGHAISGKGISFPHLQSLNLSGDQVTDAVMDSIVQCHDLRRLGLSYTGVSDEGLKKVASLKELRQLNLDSRVITDAGIAHLADLPKLEYLWLRATDISDESLRHLSRIKSLTRLDLHGSGQPGMFLGSLYTIQGFQQLTNLPQLRELDIMNYSAPTGYMGLRELKGLRILNLDFCSIKDAEVELLKRAMPDTIVQAMSGGLAFVPDHPVSPPPPLPTNSVFLSGRAVDEDTGQPVPGCTLQFGAPDPAKPDQMIWAEADNSERGTAAWVQAAQIPPIEVSGNDPRDKSVFWGETFRTGKVCARIIAPGYQPFLMTPNPSLSPLIAPLRMTNLVLQMRHGGDLRGIVFDYRGNPMPDFRVYLDDVPYFSIRNGKVDSYSKSSPATTDPAGRFTLAGGDGTEQKVVFASPDGRMVWAAPKVDPEHEARVTLPQPATLTIRYDIPNDAPIAQLFLNFTPPNPDTGMSKGISFGLSPTVSNKAEIVLTNLTPGDYSIGRRKVLSVGGAARAGGGARQGSRFIFLDQQTFVLEPGRTQRVELVRPSGQTVRGEVAGITENGTLGAYIYAYSGKTNIPDDMLGWGWPFDATTCGTNGLFQTARLAPGTYTIVAIAYKEPRANPNPNSGAPDFVGTANVTVTTNAAPQPLKIKLLDRASATTQPSVQTGRQSSGEPSANPQTEISGSAAEPPYLVGAASTDSQSAIRNLPRQSDLPRQSEATADTQLSHGSTESRPAAEDNPQSIPLFSDREAETRGRGPIDKPGPAHDVLLGEAAPIARIEAVDRVVAKDGVVLVLDLQFLRAVAEHAADVRQQDMPAVMAVARFCIRIKSINLFEVRRVGVQTDSIDPDMAVVANAEGFARQADQALDVELVRADLRNVLGIENNDLSASRAAEVIGQAVHQQVVAGVFDALEDGSAFVERDGPVKIVRQSEALFDGLKRRFVGAAPEGDGQDFAAAAADPQVLFVDNAENFLQGAGVVKFAVLRGNDLMVDGAMEGEFPGAGQQPRHDKIRIVAAVLHGDAEQGGLHGAGGDFEGLREEGADAHRQGDGHEQDFHIVAPDGARIGPQELLGGLFQFGGAGGQGWVVGAGVQGGFGLLQGGVEEEEVLRGEQVALGVAQFAQAPPLIGGVPELAGVEPGKFHFFVKLSAPR
jgi:beta-lactamase regulating signal transducer with metallopeptidase domain/Leucine-rich repeat (LRR) protein